MLKRRHTRRRRTASGPASWISRHSGLAIILLVIAVSDLILIPVAMQSIVSLTIQTEPYFGWPRRGAGSGHTRIDLHIQPSEIDLKSETVWTFWFQLNVFAIDNRSFNELVIWPFDYHVDTGVQPKFENGTVNPETSFVRTTLWELKTRPERGQEPFPWNLKRDLDYPWDMYSLILFFAFNRTLSVDAVSSSVSLSPLLADNWKVTQRFEPLHSQSEFLGNLRLVGFTQEDFTGQQRRLPGFLEDFVDYYVLWITFARQSPEVLRGTFAFWVPAVSIAALLIVSVGRIRRLKITEVTTIFLGIPLAALPFILGALQLLPPRLSLVESMLYAEVAISIAIAAGAILYRTGR